MKYDAYWVNPNGKIIGVDMRHIGYVRDNPQEFKLTHDYIKKVYDKYGERYGIEGKAREEIMVQLMKDGWIRIRNNRNVWTIQVYNLDKRAKDNIWEFAQNLVMNERVGKFSEVYIEAMHPYYSTNTNLASIIGGYLYERNEYINRKMLIYEAVNILEDTIRLKELVPDKKSIIIVETKLSRLWKYIANKDSVFGIISAHQSDNSPEQNKLLSSNLLRDIREKYGYIMLKGGFIENGAEVIEKSFFVPNISRDELTMLGKKYDQYSIVHKDAQTFVEIGTNSDSGVGKILNRFSTDERGNLIFTKELIKKYFSSLLYGPHKDVKILFKLQERESPSFNRVAYNKMPLQWHEVLVESLIN